MERSVIINPVPPPWFPPDPLDPTRPLHAARERPTTKGKRMRHFLSPLEHSVVRITMRGELTQASNAQKVIVAFPS